MNPVALSTLRRCKDALLYYAEEAGVVQRYRLWRIGEPPAPEDRSSWATTCENGLACQFLAAGGFIAEVEDQPGVFAVTKKGLALIQERAQSGFTG